MAMPMPAGFPNLDDVDGLLVDLDNTLYPYEAAHRRGLAACHDRFRFWRDWDLDRFSRDYREARQHVTDRLAPQGACRSRLLAFQSLCEAERMGAAHYIASELDQLYWSSFIQDMQLHPFAEKLIDDARAKDIPICVVSDMTAHVQVRKLEKLGLIDRIDFLVTSEEVGAEKPDRRMFDTALSKIGILADRAMMVGDDLRKDIDGARAAGIRAWRFCADHHP